MERLGKQRHGREGRRLREREVSESNPVMNEWAMLRDPSTPLRFAQNDESRNSWSTSANAFTANSKSWRECAADT